MFHLGFIPFRNFLYTSRYATFLCIILYCRVQDTLKRIKVSRELFPCCPRKIINKNHNRFHQMFSSITFSSLFLLSFIFLPFLFVFKSYSFIILSFLFYQQNSFASLFSFFQFQSRFLFVFVFGFHSLIYLKTSRIISCCPKIKFSLS